MYQHVVNLVLTTFSAFLKDNVGIPDTFEMSGDLSRQLGDEAEQRVFNCLKSCNIPGLQLVYFHGTRIAGGRTAGELNIIREVDFTVFAKYKGRCFFIVLEVKCNMKQDRGTKGVKKHATKQLNDIEHLLRIKLKDQIKNDKVQVHVMWPNLPPLEPACDVCKVQHQTFGTKPLKCQPPGMKQQPKMDPSGYHVFKDKLESDSFNTWIHQIVSDSSKAIDSKTFEKLLSFYALFNCGALFDKALNKCCVLGPDQLELVNSYVESKPRGVVGLAGTGKTITTIARIEHLFNNGEIGKKSKVAYLYYNEHMKEIVRNKLKGCGVNIDFIGFICFKRTKEFDMQNLATLQVKLMLDDYKHIYIDSAEDMGINNLNNACIEIVNQCQTFLPGFGDFWVLFDPYQGIIDKHILAKNFKNEVFWLGSQVDKNVLRKGIEEKTISTLSTSFRMSQPILNHIQENHLIPSTTLPVAVETDGVAVSRRQVSLKAKLTEETLSRDVLVPEILDLILERGHHPGYCAVLVEDTSSVNMIKLRDTLNVDLKNTFEERKQKGGKIPKSLAPQVTLEIKESIQHAQDKIPNPNIQKPLCSSNSIPPDKSMQYQFDRHEENVMHCTCSVYLGSAEEMKGNEARAVVYIHMVDQKVEKKGTLVEKPNKPAGKRGRLSSCQLLTLLCFLSFCIICALVVALAYNWPANQQPDNLVELTNSTGEIYATEETYKRPANSTEKIDSPEETYKWLTNSTEKIDSTEETYNWPANSTEKTDLTEKNYSDILWILIITIILVLGLAVFLLMRLARKKEEVLKTLDYYLAISRCTCEARILDVEAMQTSNQGLPVRGKMVPVEGLGFHETPRQLRKKKCTCLSWTSMGLLIVIAATSAIIWTILPVRCKGGYPCLKEDQCKSAQDLRKRFQNGDKDAEHELIGLICDRREPTFCCSTIANNPTNTVQTITRSQSWLPGKGECGIKPKTRNGRALGGVDTKPAEFPFTALIGYTRKNETRYKSGGTLINHWYVLTGAHAQGSSQVNQISSVRLGEWSVKSDPDCVGNHCLEPVQDFEISTDQVTVHPGYKRSSATVINDIALVKLPRPAILNQGVQIVCLPIKAQEAARELGITNIGSGLIGKRGTVVGWGYTEYDPWASGTQGDFETHNVANAVQQKLSMPVLSSSECSEKFENNFTPEASHICAGGELGKGNCKGDDGGPLYYARYEDGTEPWYLLGVYSFGPRQCGIGKPDFFTRVESFIPWITRQME